MKAAWGEEQTRFFFELTPDRVLAAVEASGLRCTGRCSALNSFENRVYEVELDTDEPPRNPIARRRVAKFYRPGRWTREQILEEHEFLAELVEAEIPAIAPLAFADGQTLHETAGIFYSVFPKVGGRAPDEFTQDQLRRVGRLLGRIHNVGAAHPARHRIQLTPETYGRANLEYLLSHGFVPPEYRSRYERAVTGILRVIDPWFREIAPEAVIRVHGDCHPGNLLWNEQGPFFLDFDDMVRAPAAQDIWLLVPGRDTESLRDRDALLEGYEEMRHFDRAMLRLIEPLRALRFIHYTAWIARRWQDPAFPLAFPEFGSHQYWASETDDLEQQMRIIETQGGSQAGVDGGGPVF